jgi:hypothetical protein
MADFLTFLNNNSGAFNLLFSGVVAIATVVYAILTARLVRETQRLRAAATEPALEVTYRSRDEAMSLLDIVIKNIGSGPAYGIGFQVRAEPQGAGAQELLAPLQKLKSFSSGINLLLPGQEFSSYWTDVRKELDSKLKTVVTVTTTCRGATGVRYSRDHVIDLSELDGVTRLGTPPLLAIARSLKKLEDDMHNLSSELRRLQIDTFSSADREREQAAWEAQRAELEAEQFESKPKQASPAPNDG